MNTRDYLKYIVDEIHTVIVATVDENGHPVTSAIDIMDYDDESLYFLTAKGKGFYDRLKNKEFLAFTAIKGEDTLSSVAISLKGKVREIGNEKIPYLFEKNSYMNSIYPTEKSRTQLTVFQIYEGQGEWFDLSKKPIERASFVFGDTIKEETGYYINDNCIGCGKCVEVCPQKCIEDEKVPFVIENEHCLNCGNCMDVCPYNSVERR